MNKIKEVRMFKATDGKAFDSEESANRHQGKLNFMDVANRDALLVNVMRTKVDPEELLIWIILHKDDVLAAIEVLG